MTEVKKVDKTAETGGVKNVAPAADKVIAEKALGDMAASNVAATGAELADKAGVGIGEAHNANVAVAKTLGITPFDADVAPPVTTRDTSFAQAVATRPGAAAASQAPDGPDPEPILHDPTVKTFAQVRMERELSGEAAAISQQAYPDAGVAARGEVAPSPKARKEMERGAAVVNERQATGAVPPKHHKEKVEKLEKV